MPTVYKVLGQQNPAANTLTTIYTVPATNSAVISTITICNLSGTANAQYSLAVRRNGANITSNHYFISNSTVLANDTAALTLGITMGASDVLSANCTTATISINAFGSEIY